MRDLPPDTAGLLQETRERGARAALARACAIVLLFAGCGIRGPQSPGGDAAGEAKLRELLRLGTLSLREASPESLERAEAFFELALELEENDPRALDGLGSIAFRAGNMERAEWFFARAARAEPKYDRAYEHLALVAKRQGQDAKAEELLRTAVRLNPLNYRARNNLALLAGASSAEQSDSRSLLARSQLLKAEGIFKKSGTPVPDAPQPVFENFKKLEELGGEAPGASADEKSDENDLRH